MAKSTQAKQHTYGASTSPSSPNVDLSRLEEKLSVLENKLNQKETNNFSLDVSGLPPILPRRESDIIQRVDAIEHRLEELIKLLSE